jgi:hypothetical protein
VIVIQYNKAYACYNKAFDWAGSISSQACPHAERDFIRACNHLGCDKAYGEMPELSMLLNLSGHDIDAMSLLIGQQDIDGVSIAASGLVTVSHL